MTQIFLPIVPSRASPCATSQRSERSLSIAPVTILTLGNAFWIAFTPAPRATTKVRKRMRPWKERRQERGKSNGVQWMGDVGSGGNAHLSDAVVTQDPNRHEGRRARRDLHAPFASWGYATLSEVVVGGGICRKIGICRSRRRIECPCRQRATGRWMGPPGWEGEEGMEVSGLDGSQWRVCETCYINFCPDRSPERRAIAPTCSRLCFGPSPHRGPWCAREGARRFWGRTE
jgi:hypothetical protein